MSKERMRRVDEVLKREISSTIEKELAGEFKALVTITRVKTAPDLRHAKVFVSVLGSEAQHLEALEALRHYRHELQHQIARRVTLKFTPVLSFELDRTPEEADRILSIIDELDIPQDENND